MKSINEYKFDQSITPGDHPQVFQAMSSRTGTLVAIKFFPQKVIENIIKGSAQSRLFAMFSSFRHRNIVHYHEVIYNTTGVFIVMDWCEGNSLRTTIDRFKSIPEKLVARYVWSVLQGLEYLHEQGVTHNNLRASNILLQNGVPKITDFGLSATIANININENPYWSAPEVLNSRTFSKESDIWSLGCTIIELMTGKPPYKDLSPEEAKMRIISEDPPPIPAVSAHLNDFLTFCFKRDPADRPSAKDLQGYLWLSSERAAAKKPENEQPKGEQLTLINHQKAKNSAEPDFQALENFDVDSDENIDDLPKMNIPGPLLQLKSNENNNSKHLSPLQNKSLKKTNGLLKLNSDSNDDSNIFSSDEEDSGMLSDIKKSDNNAPLLSLGGGDKKKNNGPSPLIKLGSGSDESNNIFGSDESDDKPLTIKLKNENKPSLDISDNSDSDLFHSEKNKHKNTSKDDKEGLDKFAESDSDDDFDDSEVSNSTESLTIQNVIRDQGDLGFIDDEDPEEKEIFARRSKLDELTRELITNLHLLKLGIQSNVLLTYLKRILEILKEEPSVRSAIISQQGVMPVIEILEFSHVDDIEVPRSLLSIIYEMCVGQSQIKENFCLLGGIPPVMKFLENNIDLNCRQSAVNILSEICNQSQDNTQMFIACNGVSALVKILTYNIETEKQMISIALQTIMNIFSSQRATQQADFCRLFMKAGVLPPLSSILFNLAELQNRNSELNKMIENICELDLIFSQADTKVKIAMSEADVMENIVATLYSEKESMVRSVLNPQNILALCKSIKFIGMDPETRDNLTNAGVMKMTCELLKVEFGNSASSKTETLHIHSNLITLLADMCKLSRDRICFVAESRLLKHLCDYLKTESEIKSQTLSVIMELYLVADVDQDSMMKLLEDNLISIYLDNLTQSYWCTKAITAILSLLSKKEYHIEKMLLNEDSLGKFRKGLELVNQDNAPTYISKIIGICQQSTNFLKKILNEEFVKIIIEKFKMSSQVPVSLLELIYAILKKDAANVKILNIPKLKAIVQNFNKCDNLKQKTLAKLIIPFFN